MFAAALAACSGSGVHVGPTPDALGGDRGGGATDASLAHDAANPAHDAADPSHDAAKPPADAGAPPSDVGLEASLGDLGLADASPADARPDTGTDARPLLPDRGTDAAPPVDARWALDLGPLPPDVALLPVDARAAEPDAAPVPDAAPALDAAVAVDLGPEPPDAPVPVPDAAAPAPDAAAPAPDAAAPAPDAAVCPPAPPCGLNGRGQSLGHCVAGVFVPSGVCRDPDTCVDGDHFDLPCGVDGRSFEPWRCVAGRFGAVGACADLVCSHGLVAAEGRTVGPVAASAFDVGSCGGAGVEQAFTFTAPRASTYVFSPGGLAFDAAVYLRAHCESPATELACATGTAAAPAKVVYDLAANASVDVLVDALHGDVAPLGLDVTDACAAGVALRSVETPLAPVGDRVDLAPAGQRVAVVAHVEILAPAHRDEVHFATIDLDGRTVVAPRAVSPHQATAARVAWNGADYGVACLDADRGATSLYFARIGAAGAVGPEVRLTNPVANAAARTFALVPDAGAYWLVWTERGSDMLQAARLTLDGARTAGPFVLDAGIDPDLEPAVLPDGGGIAVVFGDRDQAGTWTTFARYDAQGIRRGALLRLSANGSGSRQTGLAQTGGVFAVTYEEQIAGTRQVVVARLDGNGVRQGAALQLTRAVDGGERPRIGTLNGEFGVVFTEIRGPGAPVPRLMYQAVTTAGAPRGPTIELSTHDAERSDLRLVALGDTYGLSWWEAGARAPFYSRGTLGCVP